jgi:hypothetical protein
MPGDATGTPWRLLGMEKLVGGGVYYHRRLGDIYRFLCAPGQRVMAIECGTDHELADARPGCGFYRYGNGPVEMESALKQQDFTHLIIHHDLFNHCAKANFAI